MRRSAPRADAGFTLIEALVALVILGTVMVAFFDFLSGSLLGARRIEAASLAYDRRTNALEIATAINPMEMPQGTLNLGAYKVTWTSRAISNIQQNSGYPAGSGVFKVALYQLTFTFPDDLQVPPIKVTRVGYHRDNVPLTPFTDIPKQ